MSGSPAVVAAQVSPSLPLEAVSKIKAAPQQTQKADAVPSQKTEVAAGETPIKSPMPGTIIRYLVKEGDKVESGMGVVILEAMKMENVIAAPVSGTMKAITLKLGAKVGADDVLAIIG